MNTINSIPYMDLYNMLGKIGKEYALLDYKNNITIFLGIKTNKINLISILQGVDNYISKETIIYELNKSEKIEKTS